MVNFRVTKWKCIVTLGVALVAFIIGFFIKKTIMIPGDSDLVPVIPVIFLKMMDVYLFLFFLVLIYFLWSLFERREE
jgi:hypothetical protein